jgi:hypothetical protein
VDLEQVEALDLEAAERRLALPADRISCEDVADGCLALLPDQPALCEDEGALVLGQGRERLADDFLGMAEPVGGGGVDPVDAELHGAMNSGDGFGVVLASPPALRGAPADRPGAQP